MNETISRIAEITEARDVVLWCNNISKFYKTTSGTISAVKDISFSAHKGEVIGLIGKNGCGKSTLLKILASVVKPSSGSISIKGKTLAVLEVGTGFIPELSGVENVRLTCRLFGLSKTQIEKILPEIIDFSEIETAINEQVKNYSQGMYLRLAIATMFSLNADIYFFDEVISVGDEAFQKKCIHKFQSLSQSGSTIFWVSQNFSQIAAYCSRCLVIADGVIIADSVPEDVYVSFETSLQTNKLVNTNNTPVLKTLIEGQVGIKRFGFSAKTLAQKITQQTEIEIEIVWEKFYNDFFVCLQIEVLNSNGVLVISTANMYGIHIEKLTYVKSQERGEITDICRIPANFLNIGHYYIRLKAGTFKKLNENNALVVDTVVPLLLNIQNFNYNESGYFWTYSPAAIKTKFDWTRKLNYI